MIGDGQTIPQGTARPCSGVTQSPSRACRHGSCSIFNVKGRAWCRARSELGQGKKIRFDRNIGLIAAGPPCHGEYPCLPPARISDAPGRAVGSVHFIAEIAENALSDGHEAFEEK